MPAVRRLGPPENIPNPSRIGRDHGCDQIMYQRVVICPGADAIEPALEQLEFSMSELCGHSLEQEHRKVLFIEHFAGKQLVGKPHEKFGAALFLDFATVP